MTSVLKIDDKDAKDVTANDVIQKYKQTLYDAPEFDESTRKKEDIFNEARAIYHIAYDYAMTTGVRKCGFAWKVAGRALCALYATEQDKDIIKQGPRIRRLGKHHHHADESIAGGGVIIGGLVTTIFTAVFCYIRITRKRDTSDTLIKV